MSLSVVLKAYCRVNNDIVSDAIEMCFELLKCVLRHAMQVWGHDNDELWKNKVFPQALGRGQPSTLSQPELPLKNQRDDFLDDQFDDHMPNNKLDHRCHERHYFRAFV